MRSGKPKKITNRISSVTNGFVQAIIPIGIPAQAETDEALAILGMTHANMSCVYCGTAVSDWDHLQPLVRGKKPSGYIHEARNLVPSCGPCNHSKGGAHWKDWITGNAKGNERAKSAQGYAERIRRLEEFEKWADLKQLPLRALIGDEKWNAYWAALEEIEARMRAAQLLANEIQGILTSKLPSA